MKSNSEPLKHLDKAIEKLVIHRRFDNITKEFDIALLKMTSPLIEFQVKLLNTVIYYTMFTIPIPAPHNSYMPSKLG